MFIKPGAPDGKKFYQLLTSSVAPRPIALASTLDRKGHPNLSPFSFFNCFGSNPPMLIFSPLRRMRDGASKHTLDNVREVPEVVINVVSHAMVEQTSLASCEYPRDINEFEKAGFTPLPAKSVRPFRVAESPVHFECRVTEVLETGQQGGAAQLILCEILCMHLKDEILDSDGSIDPNKIDLVGRMGANYYCRASGPAVLTVPKPATELGIGIDRLPEAIRHSAVLTGNDLGRLASVIELPLSDHAFADAQLTRIHQSFAADPVARNKALHLYARELVQANRVKEAWQVLLHSLPGTGTSGDA
jgi:flavin reductase (DIM6/NTAB) family NADH-FMN oxidoreductase RutF